MTETSEILRRMKAKIDALEKGDAEEFDAVALALGLVADAATLVGFMYGKEKIATWKAEEDPSFYRFASKLKTALETQRQYLGSIEEVLELDADAMAVKLEDLRNDLDALLDRERTILENAGELFNKQEELMQARERIDVLSKRKDELESARERLEKIDPEKLAAEIEEKESANKNLEEQYRPLLERRKNIEENSRELREAIDALSEKIDRLETAYGPEASRLTQSIPGWLEKIRARKAARETKDAKHMEDLARETEELQNLENRIRDSLQKINNCREQSLNLAEIHRLHFEANKQIGDRLSESLAGQNDELERLTAKIQEDLERHDRLLKDMLLRIEEAQACVKPMGAT